MCEPAPHKDPRHRQSGVLGRRSERINTSQNKGGDALQRGLRERDGPIAQPLSRLCIAGISHVNHRTGSKTDVGTVGHNQETDRDFGLNTATALYKAVLFIMLKLALYCVVIREF